MKNIYSPSRDCQFFLSLPILQEHELVEAQETSKSAKAAYEKFSTEAAQHAAEIEKLESLKDEKLAGYKQRKAESDAANSRAASLWAEAKK